MSYFYVKTDGVNNGTKVSGSSPTPLTGSFASLGVSEYYPTIQSCMALAVAGDFICVSNLHDYSAGVSFTFDANYADIMCVKDDSINESSTTTLGAEAYTGGSDTTFNEAIVSGLSISIGDNISFRANNKFSGCELINLFTANNVSAGIDGSSLSFLNTNIEFNGGTSSRFLIQSGASVDIVGGSISTDSAGLLYLTNAGFGNGGGSISARDFDMSGVTGTIIANVGGSDTADDAINASFDNCKIATGVVWANEDFKSDNQRLIATRCADTDAAMEYSYHAHVFGGNANCDISEYRTQDAPFTLSNQKISYEISSNGDATLSRPFWFIFPMSQFVPLSTTSTLEFYITCATALTDKDIYIDVNYPDGTNYTINNNVTSAPKAAGGVLDLLVAGAPLATDGVSTWNVGQGSNYKIVIDCPNGADCQPTIKINVTKPNTDANPIYIASEYGIS